MRQVFVDGAWVDALDGRTFETFDPATGAALDTVPAASEGDVDRAVRAAHRAYLETKQIYVNLA